MATDIWKDLPTPLKKLIQRWSAFPKQIIRYLLSEQQIFFYGDLETYVYFLQLISSSFLLLFHFFSFLPTI